MTQANTQRRKVIVDRKNPWNNPGYSPRQFNPLARRRFLKARRLYHLARVQSEPTEAQTAMARSMAMLDDGDGAFDGDARLGCAGRRA